MFSIIQVLFPAYKRLFIIGDTARFVFERKSVRSVKVRWAPFLEIPETLRTTFGCHDSQKNEGDLSRQFAFCYFQNMLKDRLS